MQGPHTALGQKLGVKWTVERLIYEERHCQQMALESVTLTLEQLTGWECEGPRHEAWVDEKRLQQDQHRRLWPGPCVP